MAVDLGHSDLSDPFNDLPPPAFSFLPRTLGSASRPGAAVAPESLEPDLIKNLIQSTVLKSSAKLLDEVQVINKSHSSIPNMHSKVEEKTAMANGKDLSPGRRPALGRKRARFSLMPTPRDSLPEIDYSSTIQIADPTGYYKALEQLEIAEKELKKLRGEAPTDRTEKLSTAARKRRTGILGRRASYKPQSHDNSDMLEESTVSQLVPDKRTRSPSHASTSMAALDILHPEEIEQTGTSHAIRVNKDLSSSAEGNGLHAGKKHSADVLLEKLFSSFNAIGGDEGEALLQKSLQIKPNDLSRLNLNLLEGTENNNLRTMNTLMKKKFDDAQLQPRPPSYEKNIIAAETALRRRISLQYSSKGPESMPPSDDAVISVDSPSNIYCVNQSLSASSDTSRPATSGFVDGDASTPVIINEKGSSFMDEMHSPSVLEGTQSNDLGTMNTPTKNKSDSAQLLRRLPSYEKYTLAAETASQRRISLKYSSEGPESVPPNDTAVVLIDSPLNIHRDMQSLSSSGGTSHPITGGLVHGDASIPEIMNEKCSSFMDGRHSQSVLEGTPSNNLGAQNTLMKNKFDGEQLLPRSPSYERNTLTAETASQRRISLKYSSEGPQSVPPNSDLQSLSPSCNTSHPGTSGLVNGASSIPVIVNEKCSNLMDEMHSPSILEGTQSNDIGTMNTLIKKKYGDVQLRPRSPSYERNTLAAQTSLHSRISLPSGLVNADASVPVIINEKCSSFMDEMHSPSHEERSIANNLTSEKEVTEHTTRSVEKGTCPNSSRFDNSEGNVSTEVDGYFGEEMNIMAEREPVSDAELSKVPPASEHLPNSCILQKECNEGLQNASGSTPTGEREGEINRNAQEKTKHTLKRLKKLASNRQSLAAAGLTWQAGLRRSTRIRSRPLQYWRGERFLYGRIHNSLATVIGVKYVDANDKCPVAMVESYVSDQYKDLVTLAGLH